MENLVAKWKSTLSGKKLYDSALTVEKLQSSRNNSNQKSHNKKIAYSDEEIEAKPTKNDKKIKDNSSESSSLSSIEVSSAEDDAHINKFPFFIFYLQIFFFPFDW